MHFLKFTVGLIGLVGFLAVGTAAAPTQEAAVTIDGVQIPTEIMLQSSIHIAQHPNINHERKKCGELAIFEGGHAIPMYTEKGCTNVDNPFTHFEMVHNGNCGLCVVWDNLDCGDPILYWGGPTGYPGVTIDLVVGQHSVTTPDNNRGGKSFFCI